MVGSELFDFAFFLKFDQSVKDLAAMVDQEDWNFSDDATKSNKILKNYKWIQYRLIILCFLMPKTGQLNWILQPLQV